MTSANIKLRLSSCIDGSSSDSLRSGPRHPPTEETFHTRIHASSKLRYHQMVVALFFCLGVSVNGILHYFAVALTAAIRFR